MSQRTVYRVNENAPGALITEPPDLGDLRVFWSEANSLHDGKGWIALRPGYGVVGKFNHQHVALKWVMRGDTNGDGS